MPPDNAVTQDLDRRGIPYQLHLHEGEVRSLEQAAAERGLRPDQIVRTLLFRLESGKLVVVLMPGADQVSWPKLRRHLGVSRIRTARGEEVEAATGYEPGAVSPFGLPPGFTLLADRRLRDLKRISVGAGLPNAGIMLASEDLLRALRPELGDFTS